MVLRNTGGKVLDTDSCFIMGSPESEIGHPSGTPVERMVEVTLTHSFLIGQHEITQDQWTGEGLPNLSTAYPGDRGDCIAPDCPAGGVSWFAALAFANLLSERHEPPLKPCYELKQCTGTLGNKLRCAEAHITAPTIYECEGFRLPTEAEWEYATRAGTRTAYYAGDITPYEGKCGPQPALEDTAWYCNNSNGHTHPVMQKKPNGWGLHDTLGNAYEWVNDDRRERLREYEGEQVVDPGDQLDAVGILRVWRGGLYGSLPEWNRSSSQTSGLWDEETATVSFRIARTIR